MVGFLDQLVKSDVQHQHLWRLLSSWEVGCNGGFALKLETPPLGGLKIPEILVAFSDLPYIFGCQKAHLQEQ